MHTMTFDSITEIAGYLRTNKLAKGAGDMGRECKRSLGWDLNTDYQTAMGMAERGGYWQEGADQMMEAKAEVDAAKFRRPVPVDGFDVTGHSIDVPEFLSGNPECWNQIEDGDDDHAPVISVGFICSKAATVSGQASMYWGAALLSMVDSLESAGARVELWAVCSQVGMGGRRANDYRTLVKQADQQWSPSACAFAMAHPAFHRRLMFAVMETREECNFLTAAGYGKTVPSNDHREEFDVLVPRLTESFGAESALKEMQLVFNRAMGGDDE